MTMKTFKVSYSILNSWANGGWEEAVSMYLGTDLPENPYLELGKQLHEKWEKYILETGEMPKELGGQKLVNPIVEQKYQKYIPLNEEYQILLRGVIDLQCIENNELLIQDHKCGVGRSSSYVDSMQLDYYKLLVPKATIGRYATHNPYKCEALCQNYNLEQHQCYGYGIKFLNHKNAENALNHIITFGTEMLNYLLVEKIFTDYQK